MTCTMNNDKPYKIIGGVEVIIMRKEYAIVFIVMICNILFLADFTIF